MHFYIYLLVEDIHKGELLMGEERRKTKRVELEVSIALDALKEGVGIVKKQIRVNTVDISSGGIAFKTEEDLKMGSFYDTVIKLPSGECIKTIIEIVRISEKEDGQTTYGCRFIGINMEDQFRIDVYQIVHENMPENS